MVAEEFGKFPYRDWVLGESRGVIFEPGVKDIRVTIEGKSIELKRGPAAILKTVIDCGTIMTPDDLFKSPSLKAILGIKGKAQVQNTIHMIVSRLTILFPDSPPLIIRPLNAGDSGFRPDKARKIGFLWKGLPKV